MQTTIEADVQKGTVLSETKSHLNELGAFVTVQKRGWGARIANTAEALEVDESDLDRKAVSSLGQRDLIDTGWWLKTPLADRWAKGMKTSSTRVRDIFSRIEAVARAAVAKCGRRFDAVEAYFVPWKLLPELEAVLADYQTQYKQAADLLVERYDELVDEWVARHEGLERGKMYPDKSRLRQMFSLDYYVFSAGGVPESVTREDLIHVEKANQLQKSLQRSCDSFVADFVRSFRNEVTAFCSQVIADGGKVSGHTLNAIHSKIEKFKQMNIFGDAAVDQQLTGLYAMLKTLTGKVLKDNPQVAQSLTDACKAVKEAADDKDTFSRVCSAAQRKIVFY